MNPDLGKLQRGLYVNIPCCSAVKGENSDVTFCDRHVGTRSGASFSSVVRHVHLLLPMISFCNGAFMIWASDILPRID